MQSEVISAILQLFDFILVFCIVVFALGITLSLMFKNAEVKNKNLQLYGMFIGLTNKSIVSLSIATLRYLFIIWCTIGSKEIIPIFLIFLLILCIIYHSINITPIEMIFDLFNCGIIYTALLISGILYNYVMEMNRNIPLLVVSYLLKILVLTYSTYFFFKIINEILKKNKKEQN